MIGGRSALLGAAGGSPYGNWAGNYSDVSLLLRGTGVPGPLVPADESPTPKTLTAVGNAGISTTTFKYGNSSLAFDGTGDWLTAPALGLGNGAFTIEFWVYANSTGATLGLFSVATGSGDCILMSILANGTIQQAFGGGAVLTTSATVSAGQWHHIAYTRSGNVHYLFVDGVGVTRSDTVTYPNTTTVIGSYIRGSTVIPLNGYIDDFRLTKGVARYTANFTPPTAELPANITDDPSYNSVSLLLRGDTTSALFPADESPTPKAITVVGNAGISTTTFKYGGSSLAFDGNSNLSIPLNTAFDFGTGDFTLECWVNLNTLATDQAFVSYAAGTTASSSSFILERLDTGVFRVYVYVVTTAYIATVSPAISTGTWYHVAGVRSGGQLRCYVNGVGGTAVSANVNVNTAAGRILTVGSLHTSSRFTNGFIDDLRITKVARYVKNFLPPPAQLPAI